jgi:PIN domain nuclease of toxin-antitoxin system
LRYLVDTHYLIWSILDPDKIAPPQREILADPVALKLVSKITFWEISLKYSLGKLELKGTTPEELLDAAVEAGYELLDIAEQDLITYYKLPAHKDHKDPFDRLLIWQCIRNDLVLLTADERIRDYTRHGLKLVD